MLSIVPNPGSSRVKNTHKTCKKQTYLTSGQFSPIRLTIADASGYFESIPWTLFNFSTKKKFLITKIRYAALFDILLFFYHILSTVIFRLSTKRKVFLNQFLDCLVNVLAEWLWSNLQSNWRRNSRLVVDLIGQTVFLIHEKNHSLLFGLDKQFQK